MEKMCCFSPAHDKTPSQVKVMVRDHGEHGIQFRHEEAFLDGQGVGLRRELVEGSMVPLTHSSSKARGKNEMIWGLQRIQEFHDAAGLAGTEEEAMDI